MKKRMISFLLAIVMILGMISATAITANALTYELGDAVYVNNVGLDDGYYVLEGSTETKKGTPPANADYAYFKDRVLYLKNFDITTYRENRVSDEKVVKCGIGMLQYAKIYWDDSYLGTLINDFPLTIHLTGTNRITDSLADYSIYACYEATVTFTGDGSLEMNRPMEVSAGTTVKSGTLRMTESGASDKVPMIKTENFKMEGGNLNMHAAYRSGIECTGFAMSSGKLDMTVLGNSQYTGSGLLTTGSVSFAGGTVKIQADGDAVQCSSLSIQNAVEKVKFISTAASEQDGNYMAVDAPFVTLPTELATYVSNNADGSDASVFNSESLIGYDSVEIGSLLSGQISGVASTTETLVHIYETGNGVPLEIISVIGNGTYRFFVPKHGNYTILAMANGYEQQKAKITVSGNATQNFAMVEKRKFTTQPTGGTVGYNKRHIVNWATNFDTVKLELIRYSSTGSVVQTQELSAGAFQASLSYLLDGYYYRIRAYYDYYDDAYIVSEKFYVTPDQYFTPNTQYGNTEEDIIEGITYVPNGDGTFNANVHVNLSHVDGQMLQQAWGGTGYSWYDHNDKLYVASVGGIDTDEYVFTLNNVGKNLEPGKGWRVKVYLADDPYADWEWQGYNFHYFTDIVPELKPEDAPKIIWVGGVEMVSGTYLANGATATATTKPSVGYAYYDNGTLTLNNYTFEGMGYNYGGYYATIYAEKDLNIQLVGNSTLVQTEDESDSIYVKNGSLVIGGTGSLTSTDNGYGIWASQDVTINGGTIDTTGDYYGIYCSDGSIIINGGTVTAIGFDRAIVYEDSFIVADGLKIQASTTEDGELGEYVAANHNSYTKIVITGTDGWVQVDGVWYYYENGAPKVGWLEDGGRYYYFDETGVMQTGWEKIGEVWYYMEPSGARAVGWQLINGDYYYFYASGVMKTGWLNSGGKRYFFRPDGAMATGWVQYGGKWYCMDESGAMMTGWIERGGKKYYLQSDGVMVTGTVTIGGEVHQFDENGVWQGKQSQSQNGWVKEGGKWCYYKNGVKVTGWLKDGGKWYYFDANGIMMTGWVKVGSTWYYMTGSGAMHTGWLQLDGKWYYMNSSGAMVTGTVTIDGKTYKFSSSGVWIP